jgi:hypothetical protein
MYRANYSFSVLQAIAVTAAMAIVLWSIGLPSLRLAEAANVTFYSDTLSTSEPLVDSNHTIVFTTPTGVANGSTITIDFTGFTGTSSIVATDIDVATTTTGDLTVAANCSGTERIGAAWQGNILVLTFCAGDGGFVGANGTTTIEIGNNATFQATGVNQLNNPAAGSYDIELTAGASDSGETRVAIVNVVTVSATVDTVFNFSVAGVATGQPVNGTTTSTTTTATAIDYGLLEANVVDTGAQDLQVTTNARNGFTVTVVADGMLRSANLADIDGFANGNYQASPIAWTAPAGTPGLENTYGHWGLTSNDSDYFASGQYVSASTTPVEIYTHNGPANGTGTGQGITRVGYTVQISSLQEAAGDYSAILTYVATPVF